MTHILSLLEQALIRIYFEMRFLSLIPNILSFSRLPLALLFLWISSVQGRLILIALAMLSDGLDGFLARRYHWRSYVGTLLDPIMDKLFVGIVLAVFWWEQKILIWECLTLLSRDLAVLVFGVYLWWKDHLARYNIQAIWFGKLMTFVQFIIFGALTLGIALPPAVFILCACIGLLALFELFYTNH